MKKIQIYYTFLISTIAIFALPYGLATVFSGGGIDSGVNNLKGQLGGTGIIEEPSITITVMFWVKVYLVIAGIIAFVAFLWAGFLYLTSFASEENPEKAKKVMMLAVIGILIILFSYALTNLFMTAAV